MHYSHHLFAIAASTALAVAAQASAFSTDDASMNNEGKAAQFSDPDEKMPMGLSANYDENNSGTQQNNNRALTNSPASAAAMGDGYSYPYVTDYPPHK